MEVEEVSSVTFVARFGSETRNNHHAHRDCINAQLCTLLVQRGQRMDRERRPHHQRNSVVNAPGRMCAIAFDLADLESITHWMISQR